MNRTKDSEKRGNDTARTCPCIIIPSAMIRDRSGSVTL